MQTQERARALRRRNVLTGLALILLAPTSALWATDEGMKWAMWRDAPLLALLFVAASIGCGFLAWRTTRE